MCITQVFFVFHRRSLNFQLPKVDRNLVLSSSFHPLINSLKIIMVYFQKINLFFFTSRQLEKYLFASNKKKVFLIFFYSFSSSFFSSFVNLIIANSEFLFSFHSFLSNIYFCYPYSSVRNRYPARSGKNTNTNII